MTMIEQVARASFASWRKRMNELGLFVYQKKTFEDMNISEREFAFIHARAIIEAMREPTEEMNVFPITKANNIAQEIYQAMIDAALKEE